jgi:hypothetical protein
MTDAQRAANKERYLSMFNEKINREQLIKLIECYRQRKYIEDIEYLQNDLGGSNGLRDALSVSVEFGVETPSLEAREAVFGTNYKEGPQQTPFC